MTGEENGERAIELLKASISQQKSLVKLLAAVLAITLLAMSVGALVAWHTLHRVEDNAASIEELEMVQDQQCASDEREHATNVRQYGDTLLYLDTLKRSDPSKLRDPITQFIVLRLPETEKRARVDTAPPACDEPGVRAERRGAKPVGLPEPDPKLPERTAADVQRELRGR